MKRVESDLRARKSHNDCKHHLEPCAFDNEGHKQLRVVGGDQGPKDKGISSPDLWSVLNSVKPNSEDPG